ncbi:hypothetical protein LUX29_12090 [Aureimonas altamirensis]|uniref:hypothetical protein n=1 Tax=Aureimonas altamirensis TaxID=370622 RepID=UPI001E57B9F6|nr:hypothetical protein [Aureimonas altamirensis]UHD43839.1 hypothetical protein LUX29_12090 [Aureimonas altamirensis]
MAQDALFDIAATLVRVARPGKSRKKIIRQVQAAHPGASRKDVVKAAFYAVSAYGDDMAPSIRRT